MRTRSWIILISVLLLACLGMSWLLFLPGSAAAVAEIRSDGVLIKTVSLLTDQQFTVTTPFGGQNTVTVRNGSIAVTDANCPDGYCMQRGFCDRGTEIVCLPNRLVISFAGNSEIDAAIG